MEAETVAGLGVMAAGLAAYLDALKPRSRSMFRRTPGLRRLALWVIRMPYRPDRDFLLRPYQLLGMYVIAAGLIVAVQGPVMALSEAMLLMPFALATLHYAWFHLSEWVFLGGLRRLLQGPANA